MRLNVRLEGRYPEGAPSYTVAVGCDVAGSLDQLPAMARMIEEQMRPAPAQTVEGWLAELSVLVPRRPDDEFTEELRVAAYASRLSAYPADVVRSALLDHVWKFWPSWEELHRACEALATPRRQMLAACRQRPAEAPRPTQERVSPDAAREILEAAGFTARRFQAVAAKPMAKSWADAEKAVAPERVPTPEEIVARPYPPGALERTRAAASSGRYGLIDVPQRGEAGQGEEAQA